MEAISRFVAGKGFYFLALILAFFIPACSSKHGESSEVTSESQPAATESTSPPASEPVTKVAEPQKASQAPTEPVALVAPAETPVPQTAASSADSFKQRLEKITGKTYPSNKELQDKAEQGDVASQVALAKNQVNAGHPEEAVKWYRKAAEQNDPVAQNDLGALHVFGMGVEQDFNEAVKLFTKAAEQGYGQAQYSLGLRYVLGQGVDQDFTQAAKWFGLAADQGIADAQLSLGRRYAHGEGVAQDYAEAYAWYKISLPEKPDAQALMDELGPKLTPKQMEIALERAKNFVPNNKSR